VVKRSLSQLDVNGSRVLVRVDFNVPIEQGIEAIAGYDQRLRATLPTIQYLIERGCRTILCSHLGRPRGKVDESLRLGPVGDRLAVLLGHPVKSLPQVTGPDVEAAIASMAPGDVVLLENLRFDAGEEANDPVFAQSLGSLADYFVMDAFAVAHRAHASTVGVTGYLPSAMGFLVEREVMSMGRALESPEKPLAALMGGAKVSDKILLLENILDKLDHLFIGGGMCVTFLKAQGYGVGASQVEEDRLEFASQMLDAANARGIEVHLPDEVVVASEFAADPAEVRVLPVQGVPDGGYIMDISPASAQMYARALQGCRTVIWNGPMGVFEMPRFSEGTRVVAEAIASAPGVTSVVGGGSTAETVEALGLMESMTHVSTGGGASLEFLGGLELPGIAALPDAD
jgi:phosphoglycerate kinase